MVARLGAREIQIQRRELRIASRQRGGKHEQPLAAARLDHTRDEQAIEQLRFALSNLSAKLARVWVGCLARQSDVTSSEHQIHALEVFELLTTELEQRLDQCRLVGVARDQRHPV